MLLKHWRLSYAARVEPGSQDLGFLFEVDSREASRMRKAGCRHCGGVLHSARYGRKPRGIPSALAAEGECAALRHSFCCALCRRRTTPASVRFFGRRVYVGLIFVLLPALLGSEGPTAAAAACRKLHLSLRTLRRWRRWWQEDFAGSAFWRGSRRRFAPGVEEAGLPLGLVNSFEGVDWADRGVQALFLLREWFSFLIVADGDSA